MLGGIGLNKNKIYIRAVNNVVTAVLIGDTSAQGFVID